MKVRVYKANTHTELELKENKSREILLSSSVRTWLSEMQPI